MTPSRSRRERSGSSLAAWRGTCDAERRWAFSYALDGGGQREIREDVVAYLLKTEKVVMALRNMTASADPDDEALPSIPPGYLPIGSNLEEGTLLLDIGDRLGQIWFWPQSDWRWGTEGNTRLGFVANDFEAFINGLRPDPL